MRSGCNVSFPCISAYARTRQRRVSTMSLQLAGPDGGLLERPYERRALRRECELDGLVPRHGSSFVEGGAGSRLAEPGAGCAEVALAPGRVEREDGEGSAELLVFRVDGSLEVERVFVSSEASGGQGETVDLDRLLHHVFACERGFESAQPVLLGEGVVPPVHCAVGEEVIRRAHVHDI